MHSFSSASPYVSALFVAVMALLSGPTAAQTNLIANPSMELQTGTKPTSWSFNSWGSNTATFTYVLVDGRASNRSCKIELVSYQSGDAKWYFDDVSSVAGQQYTISLWYKSDVTTRVTFRSTSSSGVFYYDDVASSVPASPSGWTQFTGTFIAPSGSTKLTVFHILEKNGYLMTDEFSLFLGTTTASTSASTASTSASTASTSASTASTSASTASTSASTASTSAPSTSASTSSTMAPTNLVPNPSVETASGSLPASFASEKWGTNTVKFEYLNTGRTGTRSLKVTVTKYTSGDAKYTMNDIALAAGKDYLFSVYYMTNTLPKVVAKFVQQDASEIYYGLPDPEPAANGANTWQLYEGPFYVPPGTVKVALFVFLDRIGWVQTDDYRIINYKPAPFNRAMISLTFDDGFEINVQNVLPLMTQYGFKTTQCFCTQFIEGLPAQVSNVQLFANKGHEICGHSVTHPFLTTMTTAQQDYELQHSRDFLRSITSQNVDNFATPFGDYNAALNVEIKKYYSGHRTTDEGWNSKDMVNFYRVKVQNMVPTTTLAEFQGWVNKAIEDKTWLVLVYHMVADSGLDAYDTYLVDFKAQMAWLKQQESKIAVLTYQQAVLEAKAQISS